MSTQFLSNIIFLAMSKMEEIEKRKSQIKLYKSLRELKLEQFKQKLDTINSLTKEEMARIIRFGTHEDLMQFTLDRHNYLLDKFERLGGWTPQLSKQIGWNKPH
jgi:hypothetical protein